MTAPASATAGVAVSTNVLSGVITTSAQDWVLEPNGSYYPKELCNSNSGNPQAVPGATSVTTVTPMYLWVPSGVTGLINQTISAPSGSVYQSASGPIAIVGSDTLNLAVESAPSISSAGGNVGVIDVTESGAGALNSGGFPGLKLTLPPGFTWAPATSVDASGNITDLASLEYMWGSWLSGTTTNNTDANITFEEGAANEPVQGISSSVLSNDGRELDLGNLPNEPSDSAQYIKIVAGVTVDEATAQTGNITVTVGGQTSSNVSTLVIGNYGSFGLTTDASGTAPTITAGIQGSTIGEWEVKEGIPGSILNGRTITLTLPTNVAWSEFPTLDTTLSTNTGSGASAFTDWQIEGTTGNRDPVHRWQRPHRLRPDSRPVRTRGLLLQEHGSHPGCRFQRPPDSGRRR